MDENDDLKPGTYEDFAAITPERWEELREWSAKAEEEIEKVNLVPLSKEGEAYIWDRYPVFILFSRFDLQEVASSECETALTEEELRDVQCEFIEEHGIELQIILAESVKAVLKNRE